MYNDDWFDEYLMDWADDDPDDFMDYLNDLYDEIENN